MKAHTFNDVDRLTEICELLKTDVSNGFKPSEDGTYDKIIDNLEECQEIIEIHERNCLNLCILGGLEAMLKYISSHPDAKARLVAC